MIDLLIITYNGREFTKNAITSAISNTVKPQKVILVDNNSTDGTVQYIKDNFDFVEIISLPYNAGYGKAINIGMKSAVSPFVVVSNNDVIFPDNFFEKLIASLKQLDNNTGVLGVQQLFPDGSFQNSYGRFHNIIGGFLDICFFSVLEIRFKKIIWKFGLNKKVKKVGYVDGALLCINKTAFEKVGGFDENFFFYSEEVDLCKRMQKSGFKILFDPNIEVIHYRGQGIKNNIGLSENKVDLFVESRIKYCRKHLSDLETKIYILLEAIFYQELGILHFLKRLIKANSNRDNSKICFLISKRFFGELKNNINF
ncbi:MAG: glycosyltransferase family 2 protein [Ignavibacteria bacterium]|nr:glycosyltransferase family 2 protein [Ignavibacteria bacterium]